MHNFSEIAVAMWVGGHRPILKMNGFNTFLCNLAQLGSLDTGGRGRRKPRSSCSILSHQDTQLSPLPPFCHTLELTPPAVGGLASLVPGKSAGPPSPRPSSPPWSLLGRWHVGMKEGICHPSTLPQPDGGGRRESCLGG